MSIRIGIKDNVNIDDILFSDISEFHFENK